MVACAQYFYENGSIVTNELKTVTVLGSTGSVGCTTVRLLAGALDRYRVVALTAGSNWALLAQQTHELCPKFIAIADVNQHSALKEAVSGLDVEVMAGPDGVVEAASKVSDIVMAGIVGVAGLPSTMAAVRRGAAVAFANKECLVSGGSLVIDEVAKAGAKLMPVDSEHNAVFQVFEDSNRDMVDKIILTSSGGPFRNCSLEEMANKTQEQALAHPNFDMGSKISIDSATMMNKALEVIEAHHLFAMPEERIEVLIHPEQIIHSLVSYRDGSVLAQLGTPDMTTPIAHALAWPNRMAVEGKQLDLARIAKLTFEPPDPIRFPALRLVREVVRDGGGAATVFNAANEIAVANFLKGRIGFADIVSTVERVLEACPRPAPGTIDDVLALDSEIRSITARLVVDKHIRSVQEGEDPIAFTAASL